MLSQSNRYANDVENYHAEEERCL